MNIAYSVTNQTRSDDRAEGSGLPLGVLRLILLPLSPILWGIGCSRTDINNAPVLNNARYKEFPIGAIFGSGAVVPSGPYATQAGFEMP